MLSYLEVDTGFEPVYTALQAAASPLGQSTVALPPHEESGQPKLPDVLRADDEIRTRDPHLGKVMRYQLRHIRVARIAACLSDSSRTSTRCTNSPPPLGSMCEALGCTLGSWRGLGEAEVVWGDWRSW